MVQRLSNFNCDLPWIDTTESDLFGSNPFSANPALAVLAMGAVASSARIEAELLSLFVQLLGGNSLAADIYLSLEGDGPKKVVIETAAKGMSEPYRDLLGAILDITVTNGKARNKLVHWKWTHSPQLPDAVMLEDNKSSLKLRTYRSTEHVYVYVAKDFEDIIAANGRLREYIIEVGLLAGPYLQNPEGEQRFRQLCDQPEIRERFDRRKARKEQATPKAPEQPPPP